MQVILASHNQKKLIELQAILADLGFSIATPKQLGIELPEVEEDGDTFEANALKKARSAFAATGIPALADDSGICVSALDGAPGVYSARYSGVGASDEANNDTLLKALSGVPDRHAWFACAIAFVDQAGEMVATGECHGTILHAPDGGGGFGYDPLFLPDGQAQTFAALPHDIKNRISHRYRALEAFRKQYAGQSV
ncbi:RdgB/HAM1 family non-canonical purine NTP pyrophosphatase [Chrysiogenes arsenatis]|uniref:RdgB/HAM1 family non-canonical purine NTP pyrophosphatase n=1 Tax=Chrysiogenes arsenatis TaxID=309797 RepID=UPI0003F8C942|nr:RdgB/HAM1 family non-canonical purine NTP pyrophosphatase [Chrysiogenes arsenatis]